MLCQHGRGVVCHECHDTIARLCVDLNASNDKIARLRAELAMWKRATGYDDADKLDFALGRSGVDTHINVLIKMRDDAQRERDAAIRERDERPKISRDEAEVFATGRDGFAGEMVGRTRNDVMRAIRAHAASATKGGE